MILGTIWPIAETAVAAGTLALTGMFAGKLEKDESGKCTGLLLNKKKIAVGTTIGVVASAATYVGQEASYDKTLEEVSSARAYIESMSEEELTTALTALGELEENTTTNIQKK